MKWIDGLFWVYIWMILLEIGVGFIFGMVFGVIIVMFFWWMLFLVCVFDFYFVVLNVMLKVVFGLIIIVIFGLNILFFIVMGVIIFIIIIIFVIYSVF